jgi:hypothetical protein
MPLCQHIRNSSIVLRIKVLVNTLHRKSSVVHCDIELIDCFHVCGAVDVRHRLPTPRVTQQDVQQATDDLLNCINQYEYTVHRVVHYAPTVFSKTLKRSLTDAVQELRSEYDNAIEADLLTGDDKESVHALQVGLCSVLKEAATVMLTYYEISRCIVFTGLLTLQFQKHVMYMYNWQIDHAQPMCIAILTLHDHEVPKSTACMTG